MAQRHSTPIRGLTATKSSPLFQGRFGRLFRSLPPAQFGRSEAENITNLTLLGEKMSAGFDAPKDGKDDEESGIPALYTHCDGTPYAGLRRRGPDEDDEPQKP